MSQSVQLDMEVLQRIKFLMEYDVMKTSSENILLEQSTDLQKLAKEKGFGPVSISKAQELYNQGKLGNTFDPISGQAKVLSSRDPAVLKANQQKYGSIDVARTDVSKMYSQPSKEVKEMRLDELTQKVRDIMTNWGTMTVETVLTVTGIAIPVVILTNGLWLTLEVAQLLKGTPDYLNLVFSFIATTTAGLGSATLRPLYSALAGSLSSGARSSVWKVLDQLYETAKKLGLWDKVEPIFRKISSMASTFGDFAVRTWTWLKENVLWIFQGVTWAGRVTINGLKSKISTFFTIIDNWLAGIAKKAGVNPEVAQKLGSAARWGSLPYGSKKASELLSKPDFSEEDMEKLKSMTDSGWVYPKVPPK